MLTVIAWVIAVLSICVVLLAIARLARLRKQLRGQKDWEHNPNVRYWRGFGSTAYGAAMLNTVIFIIAGSAIIGIVFAVVDLVLMLFMVILSGGEGEGAN